MSGPLRAALLSHAASPGAPTGAEQSLLLLARGLAERGHEVRAVQPGRGALAAAWDDSGVPVDVAPCRQCWLSYWDGVSWPRAAWKWARCLAPDPGVGLLSRALAAFDPDVVHVNCVTHVGGAEAADRLDKPIVWHLREILPEGARRRWFAARLARASRIVAVSEAVARWVRAEGLGDALRVVPNGVDVGRAPMPREEARRALGLEGEAAGWIGFLGQLVPHKGPLEFLRAAKRALTERPDLAFFLAGAGPAEFRRRLEREIAEGPGTDRLHLLPPQPDGRVLVAAADCVCLTTVTPDPFPRSVLEAMGAGRPVVGFASGGAPEMVENERHGRLVATGDLDGLARAFIEIGADPERRREFGLAGRERARREFSIERHVERMETVLREAASA